MKLKKLEKIKITWIDRFYDFFGFKFVKTKTTINKCVDIINHINSKTKDESIK